MADEIKNSNSGAPTTRNQPSRLQRRRPASLQISPASSSHWNAAIPLLSPLNTSPTAIDRALEMKRHEEPKQQPQQQRGQSVESENTLVFKKWQHPAAPFCYEQSALAPSFFVPV